jgi:hypothetical protein
MQVIDLIGEMVLLVPNEDVSLLLELVNHALEVFILGVVVLLHVIDLAFIVIDDSIECLFVLTADYILLNYIPDLLSILAKAKCAERLLELGEARIDAEYHSRPRVASKGRAQYLCEGGVPVRDMLIPLPLTSERYHLSEVEQTLVDVLTLIGTVLEHSGLRTSRRGQC